MPMAVNKKDNCIVIKYRAKSKDEIMNSNILESLKTKYHSVIQKFLIENDCDFDEELLYKFTDSELSADLKTKLLAMAIQKGVITDLEEFKRYFCSISDDYSQFGQSDKTVHLKDTTDNILVTDYMDNNDLLALCRHLKGKIIIKGK